MRQDIIEALAKLKEAYIKEGQISNPFNAFCSSLGKLKGFERFSKMKEFKKTSTEYKQYIENCEEYWKAQNKLYFLIRDEVTNIYEKHFNELKIAEHFKLVNNEDEDFFKLVQPHDILERNDGEFQYENYSCYFEILPGILFDEYCYKETGISSRSFLIPARGNDQSFYICNVATDNLDEPSFNNCQLIHIEDKNKFIDPSLFALKESVNADLFFSEWEKILNNYVIEVSNIRQGA